MTLSGVDGFTERTVGREGVDLTVLSDDAPGSGST